MNAAQLLELIAHGESVHVEFKSSFQKEVIETLTAFANTQGGMAVTVFKSHAQKTDVGVNEGVNEGVNPLFAHIAHSPGLRTPALAKTLNTSVKNVEHWLKQLKAQGLVEFRGAPKTGGYHALTSTAATQHGENTP